MHRLTVKLTRRRNDDGDGTGGQHTLRSENSPDSAGRVQRVLGAGSPMLFA
jgi:hypothetical protein